MGMLWASFGQTMGTFSNTNNVSFFILKMKVTKSFDGHVMGKLWAIYGHTF